VAINPVELISLARKRIARIAAIRASIYFLAPALTAMVLGTMLPAIGAMTWERMGYLLAPNVMLDARLALAAAGVIAILSGAFRGWRAYSASDDFVGAAIQVDARVHANEQVVTLASLSDPAAPEASPPARSPLFPVLWRNVTAVLHSFNPEKEFAVEAAGPIEKSSLPSAAIAIALGLAMLALIRPPSPLEKTAIELRKLADKIEASATSPEDKQMAQKIKRVAINLTDSKLTPEEKRQELDAVLAEVEKKEANPGDQPGAASGGKGSGAGTSSSSAAGGSEGKGEGGQSQGQGKGTGKGEGKGEGKGGTGSAQNKGGKKNGQSNGTTDTIELKNELAKAQAQVQTEDIAANQTPNKPSPDAKTAQAPQPGNNPNQQGGSPKNPNEKGSAPMPVPQAGNNAANKMPNGQGKKPNGGTGGDTHLGEFPTPENYERFLKPGEKGMGLHLNDARYVVFKIPSGPTSGDEGKTVIDTERPKATTAYTNAPLAPTADTAPPDERQLVPPRYRDLIR
jgi:hypothetical protein